ncbi:universal stress protein [Thiobacillus sp.]|uniref:universal stress protein n=1 Tax=Thiobacillus sp. TaxID=924 RepID=UPI0025F0B29D|nr:universal stress protein [Thiobacillus sp.]
MHGRRGLDWLLLDSNAEQVARIAPVLVMLVRDKRATAEPGVVSQAVRDASSIP